MFVQASGGQCASLGVGKQIDRSGSTCAVEYFDSPTTAPIVHNVDARFVQRVALPEQVRVFHYDEANATWEIGHLLVDNGDSQLIQFGTKSRRLPSERVFVRWNRPVQDPTPLLGHRINESPLLSDARTAFVRTQIKQRAASTGISALLSCAVELEAHQIEVVRRILQDPVQRYLLADEVGLGKTIEAGVLIRQCILDLGQHCVILVLTPPSLVAQWRGELTSKFLLSRYLDRNVHVIAFDDENRIRALLGQSTMLVIDEAHHLCDSRIGDAAEVYEAIAHVAPSLDRVLLLSATPALHNERGFLRMLHLLDPGTYPLGAEAAFRRKIENRQVLAEIVAALTPENALFLEQTVDQLGALFPEDELLQRHATELRNVVETMPSSDDPELVAAIDVLHAHISEVYRLDRRILRHRRRSIVGLTPKRSGAQIVRYRSNDRAALTVALEDWQFSEASQLDAAGSESLWRGRAGVFWQVLDRASQYTCSGPGPIGFLAQRNGVVSDKARFAAVSRCLGRSGLFNERTEALIEVLSALLSTDARCVIFCTDAKAADALVKVITTRLSVVVDRHDPSSDSWTAFNDRPDHRILVCDRRGEEGLNLQGGNRVVVHYDTPLNPNRIEQRLGRVDRYGASSEIRSVVLVCEDDPYETAWVSYVSNALKVFDRSIASLQYLVEETVDNLRNSIFVDGVQGLLELADKGAGEQGLVEQELRAIDQQDALDALGAPPTTHLKRLSELDDDWPSIALDTNPWLEQALQFSRRNESQFIAGSGPTAAFRYTYSNASNRHTLVPLPTFVEFCRDALDLQSSTEGNRTVKTYPYTFSRRTALQHRARAAGVGLLRYGDPLLEGMSKLTAADDRGRSFAMWRFSPEYRANSLADVYLRFDFLLEVDDREAVALMRKHSPYSRADASAIRRRGDTALPPFFWSVWLDGELAPVSDQATLELLNRPYMAKSALDGSLDLSLDDHRWRTMRSFQFSELDHWFDLCSNARRTAEGLLRVSPELTKSLEEAEVQAARDSVRRLGQLRARLRANAGPDDEVTLMLEEKLAGALEAGILSPAARLDVVGAVFLSSNDAATRRMAGN